MCYSSGSEVDTCTEVYIRDIAPQSVADRDGRLRQGDQILQVFTYLTRIRFKHVNKIYYFNNTSRKLSKTFQNSPVKMTSSAEYFN